MKKSRLLLAAVVAAFALAASAFATPPPAATSPGFEPAQVHAVAKDVNPISLDVAMSGQGAQSALKAYTEQRANPVPVAPRQIGAAALGWELRTASTHEPGVDGEGSEVDIRRPLT